MFDVLVIGSGPAGVSAARPLVHAGLQVAMIDAAPAEATAPLRAPADASEMGARGHWSFRLGAELETLAHDVPRGISPKFATPNAVRAMKSYSTHAGVSENGFRAFGAFARGGLSNVWGAFACAFDAEDVRGTCLEGDALAQSYREVAARIGVSGANDDMGTELGAGLPLLPPVALDDGPAALLTRYEEKAAKLNAIGFRLGRARNAVLTDDKPGRHACTRSGLCLWGCAQSAVYNARDDVSDLMQYANFHYVAERRVISLVDGAAEAEAIAQTAAGAIERIQARAVVLCAGVFESARLSYKLLNYRRPHRILSNPVLALALLQPRRLLAPTARNGFALAQLAYRLELGDLGYAFGAVYTTEGVPASDLAAKMPLSRPTAAHLARMLQRSTLVATCYLDGAHSASTLRLDENDAIQVDGALRPTAELAATRATGALSSIFRRLGWWSLPGSGEIATPGADAHYGGVIPMLAQAPADGSPWVNSAGALNGCGAIYVADGSILPTLPPKHCTLTIMANAHRIGCGIAGRLTG